MFICLYNKYMEMAKRLLFGDSKWGVVLRIIVLFTILTAPFFYHYGITFLLGRSMYPTYECSEMVIIYKTYSDYTPKRGDVVQVDMGGEKWIKRVIGLPGDHIKFGTGRLWVNGKRQRLHEYLKLNEIPRSTIIWVDIIVPDGMIWIIGDNRYNSAYSLVYPDQVTGKVLY